MTAIYLGKTAAGSTWVTTAGNPLRVYASVELSISGGTFQTVEHEAIEDPLRLTVTFDLRNSSGYSYGGGAMGADGLALVATRAADDEAMSALAQLIPWHLNDVTAACAHQTVEYETGRYGNRVPSLTQTKPCPHTNYRYGSAWLVRPLPDEIVNLAVDVLGVPRPVPTTSETPPQS